MTKSGLIVALSATLLAIAGSASVAFEEQKPVQAAPGAPASGVATGAQVPAAVAKPEGTEIRIPGLGKLGTLPKMDFGLELLYGAADAPKAEESSKIDDASEDLTIKGSIKHNF